VGQLLNHPNSAVEWVAIEKRTKAPGSDGTLDTGDGLSWPRFSRFHLTIFVRRLDGPSATMAQFWPLALVVLHLF
jgi:hypothetical protein